MRDGTRILTVGREDHPVRTRGFYTMWSALEQVLVHSQGNPLQKERRGERRRQMDKHTASKLPTLQNRKLIVSPIDREIEALVVIVDVGICRHTSA